ncbi:AAA family ATPase [Thermococcus sp. 101 C5]|uniref:LAGLIDADG family homing endonuclease n=1 Tax=Thermococcus sp. 101 C5 TaxID=2654197 RepID=UPI00128E6A8A|nr:LAGLIDADG family homing endonuclease [Thermococcus sp. 101 C5]MPW38189.1 AAA family ATPase [Thermococcus sp. 101 C5]
MAEEVKEVKEVKILEKPWVEKYRPERLDDIVGQDHIVKRLKHYVKTGSMPHLLFAGPPGTGKTTSALCLARELFGEHWRHNFLELNASVSKDTPILVRINGRILRTTFAELDRLYFDESDGDVSYKDASNLEVLTVDESYRVRWAKVRKIIRHRVPVILRVHLEGGGKLELTGNHSVMVLTENGLETVKASELSEGSIVLSFTANLEGFLDVLDMREYGIKESARTRTFEALPVGEELSYMLGLYAAEGAVGFKGNTSGQIIYTLGSHERELINRVREFAEGLGVSLYENYTSSGFDRSKKSAYQIRFLSTQLAKFFDENFYDGNGRRAENKRIPGFVFEFPVHERIAFLRGLADGDGTGEWGGVVRISSVSRDLLIDTVWLARISGIEASVFDREARLIWKGGMKWSKAELLPAEPVVKMLKSIEHAIDGNWRYELRHQLYEGKKRVRKETLKKILPMVDETRLDTRGKKVLETLKKLAGTDLHALVVKKVELVEYNDFVYDVSVPGNEMFFAGEIPVLLHNSDERGINVIREKVKEFARTKPIGGASFKIIFLDEADALTQDAQQALRRTMEMFSSNVRFILSCVTGDTRIYTPDEREVKIKDFLKFYEKGLVREVSNRNGRDTVIAAVAFNSKIIGHPVFRLTLESGRVIEATGDHMFLTPAGWVQTYDLKEGSEVLVRPTLEGTPYEVNPEPIVDLRDFYEFANKLELERGRKPLGEARNFRELTTKDKEKILARALELKAEMEKGLTEREAEILQEISTEWTSREEIQKKVGLSRVRLNQLLKNLEEKGYVERRMEGKRQFVRKLRDGVSLRNAADVKRILEKEFGIKISYTAVKRLLAGELDGPAYNLLRELKKRWLVRYDDERAGILARVLGFLLGDGHLAESNTRIWFNSSREELEALAEDLRRLGLKPSEIIERESSSEIGGRKVKGKIHMLYVDNRTFHALMRFWGVEAGNKTKKGYRVPEWIRKGNLFVKREFLRGLFAADGTKPSPGKYNFNGIKLEMRTSSESLEETTEFFNDLAELLREFEVDSKVIVTPIGDRFIVRLVVTPNDANYLKFLTRVGYAYVKDKYARLVGEYLRMKLTYKEIILPQIAEKAVELAAKTNPTQAAKLLGVKRDFVVNRLNGVPIGLTRDFMTFEDFRRERVTGDYVVEKVIKKEELGYLDVYDVTCASDHSFISNGLVSHNCNYSSKIIEPIQSRCAIFRFRPLRDEDIAKRLKYIAENEGLELTEEGLQAILYVAEGDLRRAINVLQAAAALDTKITDENVFLVASRARPEDVREMMLLALEGNFLKARDKLREILLKQGLSGEDVLIQMHKEVFNLPISEPKKVALADKIGEYDFRLVEGANEMIQLEALLAQFTLLGKD